MWICMICAAICAAPQESQPSVRELLHRGVEDLRAGRIESAIAALDEVAEADPVTMPHLWQRGIALYFAGQYREGREQFEQHRRVNPHDVENATWHFLCVAATDGVERARRAMLPAPGDRRVPMDELYALYKGTGDRARVDAAVEAVPAESAGRRTAQFYADLYLGLLAHAEGKAAEAEQHLAAAAAVTDQNVMADVARVARERLVGKGTGTSETDNSEH